ncbi:MAG: DUF4430 domain-containing protein [Microgenomates group bacterium]
MNKKTFVSILFILLVGITGYFQFSPKKEVPKKLNTRPTISIKQIVRVDSEVSEKKEHVVVGSTALQALYKTHKIQSKGLGANSFIIAIDGRMASEEKREFWAYYVNGKQADVGAGAYVIKNNDTIEWKIETY